MPKFFKVDVPATSANMGPGFDTFGIALKLYNSFAFKFLDNQAGELIINSDYYLKQNPRQNLIYKAFCHSLKLMDYREIPGMEIYINSRIPSARGLGSSASAVVAGVLAAGAYTNTNFTLSEAVEIATQVEGHPDNVAPAIYGGMTISIKDENMVFTEKVPWPEEIKILVAIPEIKVHTESSRRVIPKRINLEDAVFNLSRASLFIAGLYNKDWNAIGFALNDRLHQEQRSSLIPGLLKVISAAKEYGALGATLSGSGPSVFIIHLEEDKKAINNICNHVIKAWHKMKIASEVKSLEVQNSITKIRSISEGEFACLVQNTTFV